MILNDDFIDKNPIELWIESEMYHLYALISNSRQFWSKDEDILNHWDDHVGKFLSYNLYYHVTINHIRDGKVQSEWHINIILCKRDTEYTAGAKIVDELVRLIKGRFDQFGPDVSLEEFELNMTKTRMLSYQVKPFEISRFDIT